MPRPALGLTRVNVHLEPSVLEALKWLAQARGTTTSQLLRLSAKEYVLREIRIEQGDIETIASVQPDAA